MKAFILSYVFTDMSLDMTEQLENAAAFPTREAAEAASQSIYDRTDDLEGYLPIQLCWSRQKEPPHAPSDDYKNSANVKNGAWSSTTPEYNDGSAICFLIREFNV